MFRMWETSRAEIVVLLWAVVVEQWPENLNDIRPPAEVKKGMPGTAGSFLLLCVGCALTSGMLCISFY